MSVRQPKDYVEQELVTQREIRTTCEILIALLVGMLLVAVVTLYAKYAAADELAFCREGYCTMTERDYTSLVSRARMADHYAGLCGWKVK